jgi:hypothetical protein
MGYSGRSTARFVGASETTIRRWIADDEYRKTAQPQEVIDMINSIADRIAALQDEVREALLQRMLTGAPQASVRECATAFAVLANRATPIVAPVVDAVRADLVDLSDDALDRELQALQAPLRSREPERDGQA